MSEYRLAIFDLAGTTVVDLNAVAHCLIAALGAAGVDLSVAEANEVMGIPKPVAIAQILDGRGSDLDPGPIHADFQARMIAFYQSADVREFDGVSQLFRDLRSQGIRVAVDTGFDRLTTNTLLSRLPWDGLVDDSITSDEVERGRPFPDMAIELIRRAGCEAGEAIKVGDTPSDIEEGRAAKVGLNVGVTYGSHSRAQLESLGADALIDAPSELLLVLSEHKREADR